MGSNIKSRSASKVALESFDDLFGGNTAQESGVEQIINAPLAELYTFKDHPFRVEDDEKMEETTESIRQYGVLVPGIARPREGGGYEIIAGHRRKRGSELAGKTEEEIIALLGKNDTDIGYFNADNRYVYCLGAERGFIGIDNEWLIINFVDGRVSEYNLITD